MAKFIVVVLIALALQAMWYLVWIKLFSWVRPLDVLRGMRDALVMAFSTSSSTATMPVTYACLTEKVKIREESASMGALVGPTSTTTAPPSTKRWRRCSWPRPSAWS